MRSGGLVDATSAMAAGTKPLANPWSALTKNISNGPLTKAPKKYAIARLYPARISIRRLPSLSARRPQ